MIKTASELQSDLGSAIRERRISMQLSQEEAALRAGIGISSWKRMEANGPSSVAHLIGAAIVLRCEEGVGQLFPQPAASSLDALLQQQASAAKEVPRKRVSRNRHKVRV